MSETKIPESFSIIRFPDCDPFNHLNNARYIDYMMNAREDHLMNIYNFNIYQIAKETGLSWVVAQNQIAYLRPAFLMETVLIQSTIIGFGERNVSVEIRMWNSDKTQIKALLWADFVHFNLKTQKSEPHSKELMERFGPLENHDIEKVTFEKRIEQVKNKTAKDLFGN